MAMVNLVRANRSVPITLTREIGYTLERKKFSTNKKLLLFACLPLLPIVFLVMMCLASYMEKKLEASGEYD